MTNIRSSYMLALALCLLGLFLGISPLLDRLIRTYILPRHLPGIPRLSTTIPILGDILPLQRHYSATKQFHYYSERLAGQVDIGNSGIFQFIWPFDMSTPSIFLYNRDEIEQSSWYLLTSSPPHLERPVEDG
jgi:hypothetical protein